jgi:hypothetical protein
MISVPARLSVSDGAGWIQQAETYVRRDRGTRNTSVHAKAVSAHYAQQIDPELSLHSGEWHGGRQEVSCVFRFLSRLLGVFVNDNVARQFMPAMKIDAHNLCMRSIIF